MSQLTAAAPPVRRSPLADRHRELGARFVASGEWPAGYGDVQRERAAIRERVALQDLGPLDKILLSGAWPGAPKFVPGAITTGDFDGRPVQLWGLTEDESLLVVSGSEGRSSHDLATRIEALGATATDMSSHYAALRLAGPSARPLLEALFPEDVSERALADRAITFGPLANVAIALGRFDHSGVPAFAILVERDHAEYVWDSLLHSGAALGIEPVGATAMAED